MSWTQEKLNKLIQKHKDRKLFLDAGCIVSIDELFEFIKRENPDFTEWDRVNMEKEVRRILNKT